MAENEIKYKVWDCKIVVPISAQFPDAFDSPPRQAAKSAIEDAGIEIITCFSGWGGHIDELERQVIEGESK